MAWSKVKKGKKPLMWWYHKIMCEIGYYLFGSLSDMYFHHAMTMLYKYDINIYGEDQRETWEQFQKDRKDPNADLSKYFNNSNFK